MNCSYHELFLDALTILLHENTSEKVRLVQSLIDTYRSHGNEGLANETDVNRFFVYALEEVIKLKTTNDDHHDKQLILAKFASDPILVKHKEIYKNLERLVLSEYPVSANRIEYYTQKINNHITQVNVMAHLKSTWKAMNKATAATDANEQKLMLDAVVQASSKIGESIRLSGIPVKQKALEIIDFSDKESLEKGRAVFKERKETNVYRLGLKGLNMMLGKAGGLTLGDSLVINAASHNYKSGMMMSIAKWLVRYNKPHTRPEEGKPTILFTTLENEAHSNMMWFFRNTYETMYLKSSDGISDREIVDHIFDYFNENGFTLLVERYLATDFGYEEYVERYEELVSQGHRILFSIIDYMNPMKKTKSERNDLGLAALYNGLINYNKSRATTTITGHQLNRQASELVAQGVTNVVRRFNESYIADGMAVQREIDISWYTHIEKNQHGDPYLTVKWGKHRGVDDTPEAHKYCAFPFTKFGLIDDVDTEHNRFTRDIFTADPIPPELGGNVTEEELANMAKDVSGQAPESSSGDVFA